MDKTFLFSKEDYKQLKHILVARKEAIAKGDNELVIKTPLQNKVIEFLKMKTNIIAHEKSSVKSHNKHYTIQW